jgi:tRNA1Val (adenine37-N6)-methyltransferase
MSHNNYFEFKQFTVWQNHAALRVGTDGVLLGAWVNIENWQTALDIGTGTGVIALMLAQRCGANIHAIDIDEGAYTDAAMNFQKSLWSERLIPFRVGLNDFLQNNSTKYDGVVCNPPYFINSKKPDCKKRELARHTNMLSFKQLASSSAKLLLPHGSLSVVLPAESEREFRMEASQVRLFPSRICRVKSKPSKPHKRVLMEFTFECERFTESELIIETEQHHVYTPEFKALVCEFYLRL